MEKSVHVAITRQVRPGREEEFEKAIKSFFADSLKDSGSLGVQLLTPLPGTGSRTYGILRSFKSERDREAFYRSEDFAKWEVAVRPLVEGEYSRRYLHGLEAFFNNSSLMRHPPRWKMALLTWLGVWPTVYGISNVVGPYLAGWPSWVGTGVVTLLVVVCLTWGVMPLLTVILRPWLIGSSHSRAAERNAS